jgi:hypothetical protein
MLKTTGYAIGLFVVAIAMMFWFVAEAVKTDKEKSAVRYWTSMALMIASGLGGLWFGAQTLKSIRNGNAGGNYAPVPNMPSNAAGAANVPAPGAPPVTNAAANRVV